MCNWVFGKIIIASFLNNVTFTYSTALRISGIKFTRIMELASGRLDNITALFRRLQEAKRQVDILKVEIASIRDEIQKAENMSVFQQVQKCGFSATRRPRPNDENDCSNVKKAKYDFPTQDGYVVVYTDGACENNGSKSAKAGIGVWFGDNHPLNTSEPVKGKATNNVAEIQACIYAVQIALDNDIKKLKIITDSQFTINSMTKWIKGWKKKNWKLADGKSDVKNRVDFEKLDKLCSGLDVQWEHVRGHAGIRGNEMADQLAVEGAKRYKPI